MLFRKNRPQAQPEADGPLIFRVDGGVEMGTGHLMRCFALAQTWKEEGGEVVFVSSDMPDSIRRRVEDLSVPIKNVEFRPGSDGDARALLQEARKQKGSWVIVDGYHFSAAYLKLISKSRPVLMFDDYGHAGTYPARLVLNQNIYAEESFYTKRARDTELLLGPSYVLLRKEFRDPEFPVPGPRKHARNILVTLGGTDPRNVTLQVVRVLEAMNLPGVFVRAVLGGANPHIDSMKEVALKSKVNLDVLVDVGNMFELMAWADLAISAGGTTTLELARMGVPNMMIEIADNQAMVVKEAHRQGIAVSLGDHSELSVKQGAVLVQSLFEDPERRALFSERGRRLVDGGGCYRVLNKMKVPRLKARPARAEDGSDIHGIISDSYFAQACLGRSRPSWEEFLKWFVAAEEGGEWEVLVLQNPRGKVSAVAALRKRTGLTEVFPMISPGVKNRLLWSPCMRCVLALSSRLGPLDIVHSQEDSELKEVVADLGFKPQSWGDSKELVYFKSR